MAGVARYMGAEHNLLHMPGQAEDMEALHSAVGLEARMHRTAPNTVTFAGDYHGYVTVT